MDGMPSDNAIMLIGEPKRGFGLVCQAFRNQ
jgi:hypothetical protein